MDLTVQSIGRGQMAQMQTQNLGPKYNTRILEKVPPTKSDELFTFFKQGFVLFWKLSPRLEKVKNFLPISWGSLSLFGRDVVL